MAVKILKHPVEISTVIPTILKVEIKYSVEDIITLLEQNGIELNKSAKELDAALLKLIRENILSFSINKLTIEDVTIGDNPMGPEDISISVVYFYLERLSDKQ